MYNGDWLGAIQLSSRLYMKDSGGSLETLRREDALSQGKIRCRYTEVLQKVWPG